MKSFLTRQVFSLLCCFFIFGCAGLSKKPSPELPKQIKIIEAPQEDFSSELHELKPEEMKQYSQQKGVVFARTDFQGVLRADYVQLLIVDQTDPEKKYQLHIGGSVTEENQKIAFKPVEAGYFYVELPAGRYTIQSISIPVGTTKAEETISVKFEVSPGQITYLGTLQVIGTKEKVRLGGVPVIRPGFEYTYKILDERQDAIASFQKHYPNVTDQIIVNLMK